MGARHMYFFYKVYIVYNWEGEATTGGAPAETGRTPVHARQAPWKVGKHDNSRESTSLDGGEPPQRRRG